MKNIGGALKQNIAKNKNSTDELKLLAKNAGFSKSSEQNMKNQAQQSDLPKVLDPKTR